MLGACRNKEKTFSRDRIQIYELQNTWWELYSHQCARDEMPLIVFWPERSLWKGCRHGTDYMNGGSITKSLI